jgi:hypothetical protein
MSRAVFARGPQEAKDVLRGAGALLLRNESGLSDGRDGRARPGRLLAMNTPLTTACILEESLRQVWEGGSRGGRPALRDGSQARASGARTLAALAAASESHSEGVLDWYRHRITAAPPGGLDTGIKALIRRACGFRNMGNLKRMILAIRGFSPQRLFAPG